MRTPSAGLMRFAGCALLTVFLSGCGPNVKGEYACKGGILESIKLESGGKAYVGANMFGVKQSKTGTYAVDGDKVVITIGMQPQEFTRKGNTLDGGQILGVCTAR